MAPDDAAPLRAARRGRGRPRGDLGLPAGRAGRGARPCLCSGRAQLSCLSPIAFAGKTGCTGAGRGAAFERTLCGVAFGEVDGGRLSRLPAQRGGPDLVAARDPGRPGSSRGDDRPRISPAARRSGSRSRGICCRAQRFRRALADPVAARSRSWTSRRNRGQPTRDGSEDALDHGLPNGRILDEVMPLLRRIGIEPEPAFDDPAAGSSALRPPIPGSI